MVIFYLSLYGVIQFHTKVIVFIDKDYTHSYLSPLRPFQHFDYFI